MDKTDIKHLKNGNVEKGNENHRSLNHPLTQEDFNSAYHYASAQEPGVYKRVQNVVHCSLGSFLYTVFPVLEWLPKYEWKKDFMGDMVSGFTVAVMHIPQGMAYSSLGGVPPIVGIYMAFFPVLVYFFFGSSRHISMGSFAVVCMMASKPVLHYSQVPESVTNATLVVIPGQSPHPQYTPIQVATVICLVVGMWQVVLGACRLGSLSVLMSETLVSGFTTGAAVLVFTSQLKHMFGIKLPRHVGHLKSIHTYVDLIVMINQTNLVSLSLTVFVIIVLLGYNEVIKPKLARKCYFPVPIELIIVTVGTLASQHFKLQERFNVSIVGDIPTGLPKPTLPPLELIPNIVFDGLIIAIVAFSINISMASIFARKENYTVDANQELIASGFGNMAGSLFACLPFAASLSRSVIQHGVGGKTQLASIVSCSILLLVLLFIGPFFEPLPHCVLAAIIITALKGMLMQVKDLPVAWRYYSRDGVIWLSTFVSVVLVDIDFGLGVGIIVSLASIILLTQRPHVHVLGNLPGSELYVDVKRYHTAVLIPNTSIIQIYGGMHFANKNIVLTKIETLLKKDIEDLAKQQMNKMIIDMSAVIFIDPVSSKVFLHLDNDLKRQQVTLCLTNCSVHVYEQLKKCEFFTKFPETRLFPSVQDAVIFTQEPALISPVLSHVSS